MLNIRQHVETLFKREIKKIHIECEPENCEAVATLTKRVAELEVQLKEATEKLKLAEVTIEELKGYIRQMVAEKFGQSSEQNKYLFGSENKDDNSKNTTTENVENDSAENDSNKDENPTKDEVSEKRKRGGQSGHKGHGRSLPGRIPRLNIHWTMTEDECKCPTCGKKYRLVKKFQRDSSELEIHIEVRLNIHSQDVYEKECNCNNDIPELIVAKKPNNIIYKSLFSTDTWCRMLGLKYLTGLPVNRFNQLFSGVDYEFKSSTILGGFEKLLGYMMPLYEAIVAYNQSESRWNADETSWCRLFDDENKKRLFWMWVFVGKKSVAYVLDPTRSKKVPENHFKNTTEGIVNVDRYASYNVLSHKLILAYCWYHLRRDLIRVAKKNKSSTAWSLQWLKKIREIEKLNDARVEKFKNNESYEDIQQDLITKVNAFFSDASQSLKNKTLDNQQLKILESMIRRRDGYSVFIDHPDVDMHNNRAERQFRHVAWARNNYNGSQSKWGGILAAVVWTIFKTAQMNGLDPVAYLKFYFEQYALKNKIPENLQDLLPWNCKDSNIIVQKETG